MPVLHAQQHDSYLRAYMTTGIAKVIGMPRQLRGKTKDGLTFPIELAVSRVETPAGITFAGIIHALPEDETVALVDIDAAGIIRNVNKPFLRMFGRPLSATIGANIKAFMPRDVARLHDTYLARYAAGTGKQVIDISGRRLQGLHANGMVLPISVEVTDNHTAPLAIYSGRITELTNASGVIVINETGIVQSCNRALLSIFGYAATNDIVGRNVTRLMPEPYASFHSQYLQSFLAGKGGRIIGRMSGRYVNALHQDGSTFAVHLVIDEVPPKKGASAGAGPRLFTATVTLAELTARGADAAAAAAAAAATAPAGAVSDSVDGADGEAADVDPLLGRISISGSGIILYVNAVACAMFGHAAAALKGRNIKMLQPPAIAAEHDAYLARALATGERRVVGAMGRHLVAQHASGTLLPVSLTVEEESFGGVTTFHGAVRLLAEIEGNVLADMEGKIIEVNAGLCFLLGYREAELIAKNVTKLMPKKCARADAQWAWRAPAACMRARATPKRPSSPRAQVPQRPPRLHAQVCRHRRAALYWHAPSCARRAQRWLHALCRGRDRGHQARQARPRPRRAYHHGHADGGGGRAPRARCRLWPGAARR